MSKNGHEVTRIGARRSRTSKTARPGSAHARLDGNVARRVVADREFFWWDTELPGFGLRTFPGGTKSWFIQFRQRGKQKRIVLGRPGVMSAAQARTAARAHLLNAALDGLPKAPKAVPKRSNAIRFRDYAPQFWNDYARHWKPLTLIRANRASSVRTSS